VTNYALDRIKKIKPSNEQYLDNDLFDPFQYFNHLIGVSVPEGAQPENIEIKVHRQAVPYILSKPIHMNQEILKRYMDGSLLIRVNLIINYELKSMLLSYGAGVEIRKPKILRAALKEIVAAMMDLYQ
jgi:predicted DNA-binding transcriptional regulator YafY